MLLLILTCHVRPRTLSPTPLRADGHVSVGPDPCEPFSARTHGTRIAREKPVVESILESPRSTKSPTPRLAQGFVQHNDGLTVHYPGDDAAMQSKVARFLTHAAAMAGAPLPPLPAPPAPSDTAASSGASGAVTWQGAALAVNYTVDTGASAGGPWTTVCAGCATDNQTPWRVPGGLAAGTWVRVQAVGAQGARGPYSAPAQAT